MHRVLETLCIEILLRESNFRLFVMNDAKFIFLIVPHPLSELVRSSNEKGVVGQVVAETIAFPPYSHSFGQQ